MPMNILFSYCKIYIGKIFWKEKKIIALRSTQVSPMKPAVQTHLNFSPSLKHSASFLHGSSPHGLTAEDKHENRFLKTGYFNLSTKQQQKKKKTTKIRKINKIFLWNWLTFRTNFSFISRFAFTEVFFTSVQALRAIFTRNQSTRICWIQKKNISC